MDEIPEGFKKIVLDFSNDIETTFPEFSTQTKKIRETLESNLESVHTHCKEVYPKLFFDIL